MAKQPYGQVILVGAGPGDPGLITLRGAACLEKADVVLYDYLVNSEILRHVPETCECVCLGQHGRAKIWPQSKVNERLVRNAKEGKTVVRLKSGDPIVFGRAADELDALLENEIPFQIVPGITAALAAGSYAGIPITHRGYASAVALVTGQENPEKAESTIDFDGLAKFPGTLVIYMGVTTAERWSKGLIDAGKPADTPVALVRRCSWPNQQKVICRLDNVFEKLTPYHKFPPPVIAIIGAVAELSDSLSWFDRRALFGQRILVTRPKDQAQQFVDALTNYGADTIVQPAIEIGEPNDWEPVDHSIRCMQEFDWVVFSSANGVQRLMDRVLTTGLDMRIFGQTKFATIGPATTKRLAHYGFHSDLEPEEFRAESMVAALAPLAKSKRILLARANRGRDVLRDELTLAGAEVTQVIVYSSVDAVSPNTETLEQLRQQQIDWVTVTSSAIARSLVRLYGENLRHAKIASISPITTNVLSELGFSTDVEAKEFTIDGLVDAMINFGR